MNCDVPDKYIKDMISVEVAGEGDVVKVSEGFCEWYASRSGLPPRDKDNEDQLLCPRCGQPTGGLPRGHRRLDQNSRLDKTVKLLYLIKHEAARREQDDH